MFELIEETNTGHKVVGRYISLLALENAYKKFSKLYTDRVYYKKVNNKVYK